MRIQLDNYRKFNRQPTLSEILSPSGWYDASDSSTVTLSGSNVTNWANKGTAGSGYNLTLASGTPTYTKTQNDLNVMTYDGTDRMVTTQLNSVTHIFVASAWSAAGAVSTNYNGFLHSGSYDWHGPASTALVSAAYAAAWVDTQPTQSTSQLDGSNFVNVSNNKWTTFSIYSINLQSGYTGGFAGTGYGNGSSRIFLGDYGEILVYQTTYLTTDQINLITGYLAHKWGSQALLPSEHPYRQFSPFLQDEVFPFSIKTVRPTPTTIAKTKISPNRIVTDGLVLNLDAGYRASYNGTGTTWIDVSGNDNNGTLVNGVGYDSADGGSLTFDGTNDYVTIPASSNFNFGTGDLSIEAWIYWDGTYSLTARMIYATGGSGSLDQFGIFSGLGLYFGGVSNNVAANFPPINTWSHVVTSRIGTTIKHYINGVETASGTQASSIGNSGVTAYIGYRGADGNHSWSGKISNVRIYKGKGLAQEEVLRNYNILKGRFGL